jgi:hypothetical protein
LAQNQNNVYEWSDMSTSVLLHFSYIFLGFLVFFFSLMSA